MRSGRPLLISTDYDEVISELTKPRRARPLALLTMRKFVAQIPEFPKRDADGPYHPLADVMIRHDIMSLLKNLAGLPVAMCAEGSTWIIGDFPGAESQWIKRMDNGELIFHMQPWCEIEAYLQTCLQRDVHPCDAIPELREGGIAVPEYPAPHTIARPLRPILPDQRRDNVCTATPSVRKYKVREEDVMLMLIVTGLTGLGQDTRTE